MSGVFTNILGSLPGVGVAFNQGYRPPQWSFLPHQTSITVTLPAAGPTQQSTTDTGPLGSLTAQGPPPSGTTVYYFDAVLRVDHEQSLRMTEHPVQNGASIVDHAFLVPAVVTLEIGMSDVMASYTPGQYSGSNSKSVSAYQTIKTLQGLRVPLLLATRLDQYKNMLIEDVSSPDDITTLYGARIRIRMKQIIIGAVTTQPSSARPNQTNQTSGGPIQSQPVPAGLQNGIMGLQTGKQ